MKTQAEWLEMEQELAELKELRDAISKRIHELSVGIRQHKKYMQSPPDKTGTIAYQMFGKRLKDLTAEEYRIYYNARKRINRAKRKEKSHG